MKRICLVNIFILLFISQLSGQDKELNGSFQVSPMLLGQIKVKSEFTKTNKRSYGVYLKLTWECKLLWKSDFISDYYEGDFSGIRCEPFIRFYLLPRDRDPLNGFYFQVNGLAGRYTPRCGFMVKTPEECEPAFLSGGGGIKAGFQKRFHSF